MRNLVSFFFAAIVVLCLAPFSPDSYSTRAQTNANGKIAFTSDQVIYTINADGSNETRLTNTGTTTTLDRYPAWSPDGTKIAFGRSIFPATVPDIYVMNADGSNPTRLTTDSASDNQPTWSPDGTKIAFVSHRDGNDEIYVIKADGTNPVRLTNNTTYDLEPAWSPDGSKIAFVSSRDFPGLTGNVANGFEIYVMSSDGSNPVRLTNNSVVDASPSWSADGSRIAFTTQRDNLPLVYVMNADGSSPKNVTQSTTIDASDPAWSPDGTKIAFTSYKRENNFSNADEIYVMNPDGSGITRLTHSSLDEHDLSWQPVVSGSPPTPGPTPTPTPTPTSYTVSGHVADANGNSIANVTMAFVGNVTGTQVAQTDGNGNYSFNYGTNFNFQISPSKPGYIFNPLSQGFASSNILTGDRTINFTGTQSSTPSSQQKPVLLTEPNSLRALALDSVTLLRDPFPINAENNFSGDQRTRVSFFAVNLELAPGENGSVLTAQAEDSFHTIYPLTVEYVGKVPNFDWLSQVIVKLPDELNNTVEVWITINLRGVASNTALVRIK